MKRRSLFATALGASALAVAVLSAGGNAQGPTGRTIELVSSEGTFGFVDNPPKSRRRFPNGSASVGDLLASADPVSDRASGRRVGRLHVGCIVTQPARSVVRATYQCTGIYVLDDGTITITAVARPSRKVEILAVTGGTGTYEGARGSVTSREARDGTFRDTIHLLP